MGIVSILQYMARVVERVVGAGLGAVAVVEALAVAVEAAVEAVVDEAELDACRQGVGCRSSYPPRPNASQF